MTPLRILFVVVSSLLLAGAGYLGYYGIGADSSDAIPSIRVGSGGNGFANANVK
ncbi:hypothetical protein C8J30_1256 [Rhodobacter viridis]|uniref:Uncharacterized protein n=1 Tax=Rhodobacter viridis TaxID=1054202 RepID=A0A318TRV5_9RHOB|nr:hypothetical protein [Rhodobacter viridis]PYF06570.1 hypothetical protein C8J30_1256 [Rhodobacter viridis]